MGFAKVTQTSAPAISGGLGIKLSNDGQYALNAFPRYVKKVELWKRSGDNFVFCNAVTTSLGNTLYSACFSADGLWGAIGTYDSNSKENTVTFCSRSGDVLSYYSQYGKPVAPTTLAMSDDGTYTVAGGISLDFGNTSVFKRTTGYAPLDSATIPYTLCNSASFTPGASHLILGIHGSATFRWFSRANDTFTLLTNPSIMPSSRVYDVEWSHDGTYLAVNTYAKILLYKRDGDSLTHLQTFDSVAGNTQKVTWCQNSKYLVASLTSSPYLQVYSRNGDAFTQLSQIAVIPSYDVGPVDASRENKYFIGTWYGDVYKNVLSAPVPTIL